MSLIAAASLACEAKVACDGYDLPPQRGFTHLAGWAVGKAAGRPVEYAIDQSCRGRLHRFVFQAASDYGPRGVAEWRELSTLEVELGPGEQIAIAGNCSSSIGASWSVVAVVEEEADESLRVKRAWQADLDLAAFTDVDLSLVRCEWTEG